MGTMLVLNETDAKLEELAKQTGLSKSEIARKLIRAADIKTIVKLSVRREGGAA